MTKFLAAAHDPDSLLARRARQKPDGDIEAPRVDAPHREPHAGTAAAPATSALDSALDSDMLDLITKFEQNYAELAPTREEPQSGALSDDLFPEFPEPFDSPPPPRTRARTLELARFEPQGSRDLPGPQNPRVDIRAAAVDQQAEIDEAFSILKAAEAKGAAKAQRAADDAQALAAERHLPSSEVKPELRSERQAEPHAETQRVDWAARSHRPRTVALAGGVLVLALGLTVGFIAGRTPPGKPQVTIHTTEPGGTLLRLDRELHKR